MDERQATPGGTGPATGADAGAYAPPPPPAPGALWSSSPTSAPPSLAESSDKADDTDRTGGMFAVPVRGAAGGRATVGKPATPGSVSASVPVSGPGGTSGAVPTSGPGHV